MQVKIRTINCNPQETADWTRHLFPGGSVWNNENKSILWASLQQPPHSRCIHLYNLVLDADFRMLCRILQIYTYRAQSQLSLAMETSPYNISNVYIYIYMYNACIILCNSFLFVENFQNIDITSNIIASFCVVLL